MLASGRVCTAKLEARIYNITVSTSRVTNICIYCTLRGRIKGAASAVQHGLRGGARNTAQHVITVKVLAFLTQENKAGKMQSTLKINQLKHGKGRAVRDNGTHGVVSIDQYSTRLCLVLYCYPPHTIIARTALPSVL